MTLKATQMLKDLDLEIPTGFRLVTLKPKEKVMGFLMETLRDFH